MEANFTMPFEEFWRWVVTHPNCILRAGTPEAILYDDEDLYWNFAAEGPNLLLVQLLRGKRLVGELLLDPEPISYVQALPPERESEYPFELITENEEASFATYFFVLAHGYDDEATFTAGRVH